MDHSAGRSGCSNADCKVGLPYWSLSAHIEAAVAYAAAERGVDGVVCGHIHSAEVRQFGSVAYGRGVGISRPVERERRR